MLSYPEALAEEMWHLVSHDAHGYSQISRAGNGEMEEVRLSDGTTVLLHGGDYDCSEAVRSCVAGLGLIPFGYWESYMWTGNEPEILTNAGFVEISPYSAEVGCILLRYSGHTEIVVGGWEGELYQAGFRISEQGTIDGEEGDQTGWEATYSSFDPGAWDVAFKYVGKQREAIDTHDNDEEDEMHCIFRPNMESYLMYYDGVNMHPLHHPDEAEAIKTVYRQTHGGKEIPVFELGTPDAPWATRFANAVQRNASDDMFPWMA